MVDSPLYYITFLRHGESVGNLENRFQGHADFPLTETGRAQAGALAERWKAEGHTFDRVFSSPLARARETAEIVCAALKVPLELDPGWMEIHNGMLAGLSDEEAAISVPHPAYITPYTHTGRTGESRWEVYLRAGQNIQKLLDTPRWAYIGGGTWRYFEYDFICHFRYPGSSRPHRRTFLVPQHHFCHIHI